MPRGRVSKLVGVVEFSARLRANSNRPAPHVTGRRRSVCMNSYRSTVIVGLALCRLRRRISPANRAHFRSTTRGYRTQEALTLGTRTRSAHDPSWTYFAGQARQHQVRRRAHARAARARNHRRREQVVPLAAEYLARIREHLGCCDIDDDLAGTEDRLDFSTAALMTGLV